MASPALDRDGLRKALAIVVQQNEKMAAYEFLQLCCQVFRGIIRTPENASFLHFDVLGDTFQQRIAPCAGSFELLKAVGYRNVKEKGPNAADPVKIYLVLSEELASIDNMAYVFETTYAALCELGSTDAVDDDGAGGDDEEDPALSSEDDDDKPGNGEVVGDITFNWSIPAMVDDAAGADADADGGGDEWIVVGTGDNKKDKSKNKNKEKKRSQKPVLEDGGVCLKCEKPISSSLFLHEVSCGGRSGMSEARPSSGMAPASGGSAQTHHRRDEQALLPLHGVSVPAGQGWHVPGGLHLGPAQDKQAAAAPPSLDDDDPAGPYDHGPHADNADDLLMGGGAGDSEELDAFDFLPKDIPKPARQSSATSTSSLTDPDVTMLQEMGFSLEQAQTAILLTKGNLDRAISMLVNGNVPSEPPAPALDSSWNPERLEQERRRAMTREEEEKASLALMEQLAREQEQEERLLREQRAAEEAKNTALLLDQMKREQMEEKNQQAAQELADQQAALRAEMEEMKMHGGAALPLEYRNLLLLGAEEANKKHTCMVCFDDQPLGKLFVLECRHFLCIECMTSYVNSQIDEGQQACVHLRCPDPKCVTPLQYPEVQRIAHETHFAKYQRFLLENHLRTQEDCRWCVKCETPMFGSARSPMMVCPNAKCKHTFCFNCNTSEWHQGSSCEKYQEWRKLNANADNGFDEWAKKNTKQCPQCRVKIEKNKGCDHMTCRACKYEFYWTSLKKYP